MKMPAWYERTPTRGHQVPEWIRKALETTGRLLGTGLAPSSLVVGARLGAWCRLLWKNGFRVSPRYWPRTLSTFCCTAWNSLIYQWERSVHESHLDDVQVHPPIFVLGFNRSGTTHLHNLLCVDQRFAFPTVYQTMFPNTFLTTESLGQGLVRRFLPKRRPQDQVYFDVGTPQEDEFALCTTTWLSAYTWCIFPRLCNRYEEYQLLRNVTEEERARWRGAMRLFLKKLTRKYNRPLVLKSPPHTGRIGLLLEMFPRARFIHIHRHPYTVFSSNRYASRKVQAYLQYQVADAADVDGRIIRLYRDTYDAFFEQLSLIPPGQFSEVAFEQLQANPIDEMARVYRELQLPPFVVVEAKMREYLDSLHDYKMNEHAVLDEQTRTRIAGAWKKCFDAWGYEA
ncbi:MAG: sulfotransferase family protein [Planctomycetota bacterium]|jgi:hypothetical protein